MERGRRLNWRAEVVLVGAGPGDPGLLTLAGKDALEKAEVILFDHLAEGVLSLASGDALRMDVGKRAGKHPVPQGEINRLLLEYARQGKRVVRLKGGDPYLFGRGGEEAACLAAAGIPFRVIPGVSAALAVPAYGGIPVTHRDFASSVHIVAGHGKGGNPEIAYEALVKAGGTLVFLMGVASLEAICTGLLEGGMAPTTPAALIENGTRPVQRKLTAPLEDMAARGRSWKAAAPAVLVVGEVCGLAERCDWTRELPLWGRRVAVASSAPTGGRLAGLLREAGCSVVEIPCICLEEEERPASFWRTLKEYSWIVLTSPQGVDCLFRGLRSGKIDLRELAGVKLAAVGRKTAESVESRGLLVDLVPPVFDGKHLAMELGKRVLPGERVLLYRAREGMKELPEILTQCGVAFDDVAAYRTCLQSGAAGRVREVWERGELDAVAFTSASAVESAAQGEAGEILAGIPALCIGESTGAAAGALGMDVHISGEASLESMVELAIRELGGNA